MKTPYAFAALFVALFLAAAPLQAQITASGATQAFVKNAAIGNQFEIASSQLALKDSHDKTVRQFAQQMIDDHKQIGDQMSAALASPSVNMPAPSTNLDSNHQAMLDKLTKAPAKDFDKEYLEEQDKAHAGAVALFSDYATGGDNDTLKGFAAQTLPIIQQHLQHVEQLKATH